MSTSQKAKCECNDLKARDKSELGGQIDSKIIALNSEVYAELLAQLDSPPRPNARLLRSLTTTAPWER